MGLDDIDEVARQFLATLNKMTEGEPTRQVSMYSVGESMGLDRDNASKTAEILIGNGLAEIKTLSGGIGITESAASELKDLAGDARAEEGLSALPLAPILDATGLRSVDIAVTTIKQSINELGLNFDAIAGIVADIKTIEAQLASPTPKTAIIRECFVSLKSWTDKTSYDLIKEQIKAILG